jgi:quinol monooxygenase YgiN
MAHQPIHPDGGIHKVDFECRCGHCRGFVAPERFRNLQLPLHGPHVEVSRQLIALCLKEKPMIDANIKIMVPPEKQKEVLQTFKSLLVPIRREQGCISCNCYVDVETDNLIFFKEEWNTSEDLGTHLRSVHFGVLIGAMKLLIKEPDIRFDTIASTAGAEAIKAAQRDEKH